MTAPRLLTARDVMAQLNCGRTFVTEHCAELGGIKIGGLLRFRQADIDAWLALSRRSARMAEPMTPQPKRRLSVVGRGPTNPVSKRAWEAAQ